MNIVSVVEALNKTYGYNIDATYYNYIKIWADWWKGYYRPFHSFRELLNDNTAVDRKLYTLRMAKKICEDWASILMNEKVRVTVADEAAQEFLFGDGENNAGFFGAINFWSKANQLVEKAFYSGTGAIVPRLNRLTVDKSGAIEKSIQTELQFDYLPAVNIIPISVENGEITEAAFASEKTIKGKKYVYVQIITRDGKKYAIENLYYEDDCESLTPCDLPDDLAKRITLDCPCAPFFIVSPNVTNNQEHYIGLGQSIYADAIDCLMGVDLAYNNMNRDFKLGGKKVFLTRSLIHTDNSGNFITPDDVAQQLFVNVDDAADEGGAKPITEYNPALRVGENADGIQKQLDYLSFKCGLGTKHYQFNSGSIVTATQYMGDKQELVQNASKHYIPIEDMLKKLVRFTLWAFNNVIGMPLNTDADISVQFDDSYIIDKESERLRDMQEISAGIMKKWEYRVKWYGEDEETAKAMTESDDLSLNFGDE
ncbi:MAG: phage portal protein [Acutalibacteraceae bacterium]